MSRLDALSDDACALHAAMVEYGGMTRTDLLATMRWGAKRLKTALDALEAADLAECELMFRPHEWYAVTEEELDEQERRIAARNAPDASRMEEEDRDAEDDGGEVDEVTARAALVERLENQLVHVVNHGDEDWFFATFDVAEKLARNYIYPGGELPEYRSDPEPTIAERDDAMLEMYERFVASAIRVRELIEETIGAARNP